MRWVCAYLEIEPDGIEDGHGGEPIMVDGNVMGSTASVAYGHTVGKILAFAYVRPEVNVAGKEVSVLIAGNRVRPVFWAMRPMIRPAPCHAPISRPSKGAGMKITSLKLWNVPLTSHEAITWPMAKPAIQ